ncbi:MAG: hypothetical protein Kow00124_22060 [Anaerolineae bacterium]
MGKHRVLYFHHGGAIGGAPLSLLFLLQQLDRDRWEPVVIATRPGPVHDLYRQNNIPIYLADEVGGHLDDFSHTTLEWYNFRHWWPLPSRLLRFPQAVRNARRIVERFQPDLVHINSSTLAVAALGTSQAGVPLIWHIREPLARGYVGLRRAWLRRVIDRTAARVIAISRYDASHLIPSDRIRVIYNFVDFSRFDRSLSGDGVRAELGIASSAPLILMLGGVAEPKGTLPLIEAMRLLLQRRPDARLLIAGPPPQVAQGAGVRGLAKHLLRVDTYDRRVLAAVEQINPPGTVIFTGVRQDIPHLLAASDVLVFPSTVPHFARPVIEAAAMARPAVASNLGGPAELIVDGETGILVPPGDPSVLAGALLDLLGAPDQAAAMGEAAYCRARDLFNAERNAQATLAIYDELLSVTGD